MHEISDANSRSENSHNSSVEREGVSHVTSEQTNDDASRISDTGVSDSKKLLKVCQPSNADFDDLGASICSSHCTSLEDLMSSYRCDFPKEKTSDSCHFDSLPYEILVFILSFLKIEDLLISSEVCSRWKEAARDPGLWKAIRVYLSKRNLKKFCTFLNLGLAPHVKTLHVIGEDLCDNNCRGSDSDLFFSATLKSLTSLKCFKIESKFCTWTLPQKLQHFEASGNISDEGIALVLASCPELQYINVIPVIFGDPLYRQIGVSNLIRHASSNLKTLFFCGYELDTEICRTWFENCSNLLSIGIDFQSESSLHTNCVSLMDTLAWLPHLKNLFLRDVVDLELRLQNPGIIVEYVALEYLSVVNCGEVDETFFDILISSAPNLGTLSIKDTTFRNQDFLNFIRIHAGLKRLILGFRPLDLLVAVDAVNKIRNFESICVCDNYLGLNRYGLNLEPSKVIFCSTNFKCIQCEPDDLDMFTCDCYGFRKVPLTSNLAFWKR